MKRSLGAFGGFADYRGLSLLLVTLLQVLLVPGFWGGSGMGCGMGPRIGSREVPGSLWPGCGTGVGEVPAQEVLEKL